MRAVIAFERCASQLTIVSSAEERDNVEKYAGDRVFFDVPPEVEVAHPDLLALVTILTLHPFVGARLQVNLPVSDAFRAVCAEWLPYQCDFAPTPNGVSIPPRQIGSTPGLAFSGGVDSTAALAVMPQNTECVFLDRVVTPGKPPRSAYNKESALVACDMVSSLGYSVHRVGTNMEYVRQPVGFPVDWSNGAPAILLADMLDLSSIAYGVVAESGYMVGHMQYQEFPERPVFRRWDRLLRAVGLQLAAPVVGVSEVGTALIERSSPLAGVAQSCIRGPKNQPCRACPKCMRKVLLDTALDGTPLPAGDFELMVRFFGWEKTILGRPIKHENVYRWIERRLELLGESTTWEAFTSRLRLGKHDVSWAAAWYGPSEKLIPAAYRKHTVAQLRRYLPEMTRGQRKAFERWDLTDTVASPAFEPALERLRLEVSTPLSDHEPKP